MLKSVAGALTGAVTLGVLVPAGALVLGWIEFSSLLPVGGASLAAGAVLGWLKPGLFLSTVLFFLEASTFD